jgi:hypothetical protein
MDYPFLGIGFSVAGPGADGPGDLGAGFFAVEIGGGFTHPGTVVSQFGLQVAGDVGRSAFVLAFDQLVGFLGRSTLARPLSAASGFVEVEVGFLDVEFDGQQGFAVGGHGFLQLGQRFGTVAAGGETRRRGSSSGRGRRSSWPGRVLYFISGSSA